MTNFCKWILAGAVLIVSTGTVEAQSPYLVSTYAGGLPAPTAVQATTYSFESPNAVATDLFGNTYISTTYNCVFRLDAAGNLSRVAGNCRQGFSGDGANALNAQLHNPQGLAVDVLGNLYIADQGNQRIRQVTPAGIISTVAGTGVAGYSGDNGPATNAQLNNPQGIAVDGAGNLYIADSANYRVRRVAPNRTITTYAGTGVSSSTGDGGAATAATFGYPGGLALDSGGDLYISDLSTDQIRKVNPNGTIVHVAGIGGAGYSGDTGPAISAALNGPQGLAVDASGNLYIADEGNYAIRRIDVGGTITTYAGGNSFGNSGDHGPATSAQLVGPIGVSVDYGGDLFIADLVGVVRMVNAAGIITTSAGTGVLPFSGDGGPAALAQFATPWGLTFDGSGDLYVADWKNNRIREINSAGLVSTVAGNGSGKDAGDNGQATNASVSPYVPAADSMGNLYLADSGVIRKINSSGIISTLAGQDFSGYGGDNAPAVNAILGSYLPGLAVDSQQNVYIADWLNQRVRKITAATGYISTVAGNGMAGYSGDGGAATIAQIHNPAGLAVDGNGNLYIADNANCAVRRLSAANGVISTVAGNGTCGNTGDSGPATGAEITPPWAVAVDAGGNLYIATQGNTIRKVTSGTISTIGGTGAAGYSGDGGLAVSAEFNEPLGLALDSAGNVYISDFANGAVRILQPESEPLVMVSSVHSGAFTPGQSAVFSITASNAAQAASTNGTVTLTDTLPSSVTPIAMGGTGWSCSYVSPSYTCQNSNSLAAAASYNALNLMVNVAAGAPPQITNVVTVTGGGATGTGSEDAAFIGSPVPVLQIAATHMGDFVAGSQASFTISVANQASAPATDGTVTVVDTLPAGLSLVSSLTGSGWNCTGNTCTNDGALTGGGGYSPISGTVNVASGASSPLVNQATVSGGSSASASASDTIVVASGACFLTGTSPVGVADIQAALNQALGTAFPANDVNHDGVLNVVDIQIVLNAALRLGCTI